MAYIVYTLINNFKIIQNIIYFQKVYGKKT
jgi:hypothetical protein